MERKQHRIIKEELHNLKNIVHNIGQQMDINPTIGTNNPPIASSITPSNPISLQDKSLANVEKSGEGEHVDSGRMHPLGKINVEEMRMEFRSSIERMRSSMEQFSKWQADQDEAALKKFFNRTRDEVDQRKRFELLSSSLTKCRVLGTRYLEGNGIKPTRKQGTSTRSRLQMAVASIPGLRYYEEDNQDMLSDEEQDGQKVITLTSPTILLDVTVNAEDITERVDFEIGEERDERLSEQLLEKLKAEKFLDFEELLTKAATRYNKLDSLEPYCLKKEQKAEEKSKGPKHALFALEADLKTIYNHQKDMYGIEATLNSHGGLITKEWEGYWIHYYLPTNISPPINLEAVESMETTDSVPFYSALVELELAKNPICLPTTSQISHFKEDGSVVFHPLIESAESSNPINFVLKLSPSVPLVTQFAKHILKHTGQISHKERPFLISEHHFGCNLDQLICDKNYGKRRKMTDPAQEQTTSRILNGIAQNEMVVNGQKHLYMNTRQNKAILVHRIPFTHVSQISHILQLLRQHVVFNQLYKSCFTAPAEQIETNTNTSKKRKFEQIEVDTTNLFDSDYKIELCCSPPTKIWLNVILGGNVVWLSLEIDIQLNGMLSTVIHFVNSPTPLPPPQQISLLLSQTHNIPLTLSSFLPPPYSSQ